MWGAGRTKLPCKGPAHPKLQGWWGCRPFESLPWGDVQWCEFTTGRGPPPVTTPVTCRWIADSLLRASSVLGPLHTRLRHSARLHPPLNTPKKRWSPTFGSLGYWGSERLATCPRTHSTRAAELRLRLGSARPESCSQPPVGCAAPQTRGTEVRLVSGRLTPVPAALGGSHCLQPGRCPILG